MARAPMPAPQMIETPAMRRSALLAKMLEQQKRWVDIFSARRDNAELDHLCEQVEIMYELRRKTP